MTTVNNNRNSNSSGGSNSTNTGNNTVYGSSPPTQQHVNNAKVKKQFTPIVPKHIYKNTSPHGSSMMDSIDDDGSSRGIILDKPTIVYNSDNMGGYEVTVQKEIISSSKERKNNSKSNSNNKRNNKRLIEEDQEDEEIDTEEFKNQIESMLMQSNRSATKTTSGGKVFLKIKRKIDDEPLEEIIIQRPKKKPLLDVFRDFNLSNNNNNQNNNNNNQDNQNNDLQQPDQQPVTQEKKLFTLFTSIDENTDIIQNKSKIQQRYEEYKLKGNVDSPKISRTKRENVIKQRNEIRYKQIKSNRQLFSGKGSENIIELEKQDNDIFPNGLTKEQEELISNYRPLLKEHLNHVGNDQQQQQYQQQQRQKLPSITPKKVQYVYDYYYLDNERIQDLANLTDIQTVQLPEEDDLLTDELGDEYQDDSSTDSENWYQDYPDGDEVYSDAQQSDDDDDDFCGGETDPFGYGGSGVGKKIAGNNKRYGGSDSDEEEEINSDYDNEYIYADEIQPTRTRFGRRLNGFADPDYVDNDDEDEYDDDDDDDYDDDYDEY